MNLFYAILLGLLQGATEFLPVSSSAHLALAEHFLGFQEAGLTFDVALHLGTLVAILAYFHADFRLMAQGLLAKAESGEVAGRKILGYITLATVPGVVAGLLLEKAAETTFRAPGQIAAVLAGAGVILLLAERCGRRERNFAALTLTDALVIGLSQALAIVPGVSRSGITISAGLFRGLERRAAARFSFLLSAPIIFGAGLHHIPKIIHQGLAGDLFLEYLLGFGAAALSGYLVIALLMRFLLTRTFAIFAYYRFLLAGVVVLALLFS